MGKCTLHLHFIRIFPILKKKKKLQVKNSMRKALLINWSPILNEGFSYSIASLSVLLHNLYLHPNQLTFIITWGRFVQLWHLHDYNMILFPWWCLCSSHNVCCHWKLENRKCKINVKAIITKNQNKIKKILNL